MRIRGLALLGLLPGLLLALLAACGGESISPPETDSGVDVNVVPTACDSEGGPSCDNGLYCDGVEVCDADAPGSDPVTHCVPGTPVVCDDDVACTSDACDENENRCEFTPPDTDRDGHPDVLCVDGDGQALGDDCDDNDATRFPGNTEVCSPGNVNATRDEDCNVNTAGDRDDDNDNHEDDACCNPDTDGSLRCGDDCNDGDMTVYPGAGELCDSKDNDCDLIADESPINATWYVDADGDQYGDPEGATVVACAPQSGYSTVPTDCDDTPGVGATVNPGNPEACDGIDNNCNEQADEGLICADVDECLTDNGGCGDPAFYACTNNVDAPPTCADINECLVSNGGCDALSQCTNQAGALPSCGACPSGYLGDGYGTCAPTLTSLGVSSGVMSEALNTTDTSYALDLGLFMQTLTLTATAPPGVTITINGQPRASGTPYTTAALPLGPSSISIAVTQAGRPDRIYTLSVTRGGGQQAYLKTANPGSADYAGYAVAISGDTLVIAASNEDSGATGVNGDELSNTVVDSGAAFVFVRSGDIWTQQAYLKASNTGANDEFGTDVAIDGDTLVVGAAQEASAATTVDGDQTDNTAANAGAAYVFVRSSGTWTQQAYLKASNAQAGDSFGAEVALSADTIIVGARNEDSALTGVDPDGSDNNAGAAGAAYVFVREGDAWSQQAYLKARNTTAGDWFGYSVAIDGDTAVVGAISEESSDTGINGDENNNNLVDAGAAYVFVREGDTWSQQAYVKASNTGPRDLFGCSVAVSGDTVVVGARWEGGTSNGVNGNQTQNDTSWLYTGAAYIYTRSGTTWSQQAYVKPSNSAYVEMFGGSVAIDGDLVVIGASGEVSSATGVNGNQLSNGAYGSGAAYVFGRIGTQWNQVAYVKASNTGANDRFGIGVDVDGDTVVIGADQEDSNGTSFDNSISDSGAVYVFR